MTTTWSKLKRCSLTPEGNHELPHAAGQRSLMHRAGLAVNKDGERMRTTALLATTGVALLFATPAMAQRNFGEFLDMRATKVLKPEWDSVLPASIRAPTAQGSNVTLEFARGGTLSGEIVTKENYKSRIKGTWTMDASGKLCIFETFEAFNNQSHQECGYRYRLNGNYYGTTTDSDRSAPVRNPLVPYQVRK